MKEGWQWISLSTGYSGSRCIGNDCIDVCGPLTKATAKYEYGVLTLELPKKASSPSQRIAIQ